MSINKNYLTFTYKKHSYIGGNQSWYKNYTQKIGACGTVAAVNMLVYMAKSNVDFQPLFKANLSYQSYLDFMNDIYYYVKPGEFYQAHKKSHVWKLFGKEIPPSFGILNQNRIDRGMRKYGKRVDLNVSVRKLKRPKNYEVFKKFIGDGLQKNRPIALRNMFHSVKMRFESPLSGLVREVDYKLHWVTIIGIAEGERTDIEVLTWSGVAKIDLEALWMANKGSLLFPIRALYIN